MSHSGGSDSVDLRWDLSLLGLMLICSRMWEPQKQNIDFVSSTFLQLLKIYSTFWRVANIDLPWRVRGLSSLFLHLPCIPHLLSRASCPLVSLMSTGPCLCSLRSSQFIHLHCWSTPWNHFEKKLSEETEVLDTQLLNFSTLGMRSGDM